MLSLRVEQTAFKRSKADVLAYFVFEKKNAGVKAFTSQTQFLKKNFRSVTPAMEAGVFTGKFQETLTLFPSETRSSLVLVGLGTPESLTLERLRRVAATAAKTASGMKAKSLGMTEPDAGVLSTLELGNDWESIGSALTEGAVLSLYKFAKYFSDTEKKNSTVQRVSILCPEASRVSSLKKGMSHARIVCEATCFARDLANAPPNEIYPETLAERAKAAGRRHGFSVTVLDERRIKQLKMGGVLGVSQGSDRPPRFIIMEHKPKRSSDSTLVLVGKGVTFDAGGISIKPATGMSDMKMDMSGAAAVIATMGAVAELKLPVHIVGLVPAVENLLGGAAMKPGDVIVHLNGKTSEVDNTDAEGRLILADALSYASRYRPEVVIDLATLTGAIFISLGHYATGMMGNAQDVMDSLRKAGDRVYERVWQMPMFEEYEKQNRSDVADVKNSGGRPAGAITAAFFLKQFIGDYKWVHLDIAGTATLHESLDYIPKGASGVGVRLLAEFLRTWRTA